MASVRASWTLLLLLGVAFGFLGSGAGDRMPGQDSPRTGLRLTHACIITNNIERLRTFYREVLEAEPHSYSDDYAEFPTESGTLALFRLAAHNRLAPGSARSAASASVILEFQVRDVDGEYARLLQHSIEWVKPPTTRLWGNRSIDFRDPDGNLVNFYSRIGPQPGLAARPAATLQQPRAAEDVPVCRKA